MFLSKFAVLLEII